MEQYQRSKTAAKKGEAAKAPDSKRRSVTPMDAGSPRPVGFSIDDSEPMEGVVARQGGQETLEGGGKTQEEKEQNPGRKCCQWRYRCNGYGHRVKVFITGER